MGVGLTNKDFSFYQITSDDVKLEGRIMVEDLRSLTVTEELGKMDSGTLSFNDPNHFYSRILRTGVTLKLIWGYARRGADLSVPANLFNSDVFSQDLERRGLKVFVTGPGGGGDDHGQIEYKCNFLALDMRGSDNFVRYKAGTKGDVVAQILSRLGIPTGSQVINFQRMKEKIPLDTEVMQWESDFKTLVRLSFEWRASFRIGYRADGSLAAVFVDTWSLPTAIRSNGLTTMRSNVYYEYGTSTANVQSFTWQDQSGESGVGDNVQMRWVNGQPMFIHYQAETQTVTVWEIDQEKMKAEMDRRGNLGDKAELLNAWMNAKTFEEVKRYFKPVNQETAPQGTGIITTIKTMGSPLYPVGLAADIGPGFPDRVRHKGVVTYIRKLTHTIVENYMCDHELADAYVFSPTGTMLFPTGQ